LNASPTRPSLFWSDWNDVEICFASSTACEETVAPPISTTSLPTTPLAAEPSPYEMFHSASSSGWKVLLSCGLKVWCEPMTLDGRSVLKTHLPPP
jgi:hypothetical protein